LLIKKERQELGGDFKSSQIVYGELDLSGGLAHILFTFLSRLH
jgi:hypothetical protein